MDRDYVLQSKASTIAEAGVVRRSSVRGKILIHFFG